MTLDVQVDLRDVSFGGFSLASIVPVTVGESYEIRTVTSSGLVSTLRARVVRCEPPTDADPLFASGWEIEQDEASTRALADIVDSLTSRLQFNVE